MKKVNIYKKDNSILSPDNIYEDPTNWINNCINTNSWGKPERWVLAKELMENGNPEEPEHWMWHSEHYEDSDVLQTEIRIRKYIVNEINELGHTIEVEKEESQNWVLLKADYTIEIIDLDNDYDWLLSECHRKRRAEYPPITELGDALYWKENGNESKYIEYMSKCDNVKKKYPLPVKESN
jgi:hypothetical protein